MVISGKGAFFVDLKFVKSKNFQCLLVSVIDECGIGTNVLLEAKRVMVLFDHVIESFNLMIEAVYKIKRFLPNNLAGIAGMNFKCNERLLWRTKYT